MAKHDFGNVTGRRRLISYPDPTGDTAAARADNYTPARPRKDGRTFRKVNDGIQVRRR